MINPYDRRAVRSVWARVLPGRDVFAPPPPKGEPLPRRPGNGGKPPSAPPNLGAQAAADRLAALIAGYDTLARQRRSPMLRQLAAMCRRDAAMLQGRCGAIGRREAPPEPTLAGQRKLEADLRQALAAPVCGDPRLTQRLLHQSESRSRQLSAMR